jgi:formylglycine-generating enzyme
MRSIVLALWLVAGCGREAPVEAPRVEPVQAVAPPGFVVVPAGRFTRGSPKAEAGRLDNEGPTHPVTLSRPFLLASHELTVREFRAFVTATGYVTQAEQAGVGGAENGHAERPDLTWKAPPFVQTDDHPVVEVSWYDATAYADWRSVSDGLTACYTEGQPVPRCAGWRLPTEAEWEWAARAGTTGPFSVSVSGKGCEPDPALAAIAWTCANAGGTTHPVGEKAPNTWGLYDLHGNVWEWTHDWFDDYRTGPLTDPSGPATESDKVLRGGGWGSRAGDCRAAVRVDDPPQKAFDNLGFRLARSLP